MLVDFGFTKPLPTIKSTDVSQLVKCASLHSTLLRIKSELDQFISGLHSPGVLEAIREYPSFFSPMFEFKGNVLTAGKYTVLCRLLRILFYVGKVRCSFIHHVHT